LRLFQNVYTDLDPNSALADFLDDLLGALFTRT
jgi:hypothetical protein